LPDLAIRQSRNQQTMPESLDRLERKQDQGGTMTEIETPLTDTEAPETTPRPKTITTIAILLGVIALISLVTFALSFRTVGPLRGAAPNPANGRALQGGPGGPGGDFQTRPGGAGGTFQGGNFPGAAPGAAPGGAGLFRLFGAAGSLGINGTTLIVVRSVFALLGIGLAVLCAWFVWKQKRWALNLAIVLGVLVLLGALPGLFLGGGRALLGGFGLAQTGLNALKALAALPVIVLSMLPSVRDFTA
jgi:hypothetical protein